MYYNYGADNAECNVHVLKYLNTVTQFTVHNWAKQLKGLLLKMKELKERYQQEGKDKISNEEYFNFRNKYLEILSNAIEERKIRSFN